MFRNRFVAAGLMAGLVLAVVAIMAGPARAAEAGAVSVILKNDSGSSVEVELVDQYGGNFTVTVEPGTSQNQTLQAGSKIKIGGNTVHEVTAEDEGKEIVIAS